MVGQALRAAAFVMTTGMLIACSGSPTEPTQAAFPSVSPSVSLSESAAPTKASSPATTTKSEETPTAVAEVSDGKPRRAVLSIPAIGLYDLPVVPYVGRTDDARGTRIQDGGVAASSHGPTGGTGPGGLGNYQVTAHRLASTQAFLKLPSLQVGERAIVEAGGVRYVYEIRTTRETSFRSPQSLAEQRAAVPGRPGQPATRAFVTLSTCATPEDHAAGNFWSDKFGNPEHRIDKIGVLVRTGPVD